MAVFAGVRPVAPIPMLAFPKLPPLRRGVHGLNLDRPMSTFGRVSMKPKSWDRKCNVSLACSYHMPISAISSSISDPCLDFTKSDWLTDFGLSSSHLRRTIRDLSRRRAQRKVVCRASNGLPYAFSYPPLMEEKPRWWWRTLACIPYLMHTHTLWSHSGGANLFLPFLDNFVILVDPVFGVPLPIWFLPVYATMVDLLVVKRKDWWPHFLRFHVALALLFDAAVQIIWHIAGMMPYWRNLDTPFWTVVACGFIFAVVESMKQALKGAYPEIPLFSEAAHVQCNLC